MGGILYHTALLAPSLQDADPWSIGDIGILDNNQLANGPGISGKAHACAPADPWSSERSHRNTRTMVCAK